MTRHAPPRSCTAATTSPEALVDGLDRLHRGRDHAGVPDHVGVGEVDDPEAQAGPRARRATNASAACARAHLRLVVVGGHVARRGHQLAALAGLRRLLAAVEEVRDVRVLLGLGDVQLASRPRCGEHRRERRSRGARAANATG